MCPSKRTKKKEKYLYTPFCLPVCTSEIPYMALIINNAYTPTMKLIFPGVV